MRRIATVAVAALVAVGALGTPNAEARGGGGVVVAGIIGGLAAGALLGAAVTEARAAPAYGYGYDGPVYEDDVPPPVRSRPVRTYEYGYEDVPVYRAPRVVRTYDGGPEGYGYRPARYAFRRDCDRPHGYGGW